MPTDEKISGLPPATVPLTGTELMEIVQGGVNKKVAKSDVSSGATVPDASEIVKGIAEIATQVEVDTGTDDTRFVTPLKLSTYFGNIAVSQTITDGVVDKAPSEDAVYDAITTISKVAITGAITLNGSNLGVTNIAKGTSADYTIALPTAVGIEGKMINILGDPDVSVLSKAVTIDGNGTEKVGGRLTQIISTGGRITLVARSESGVGSWDVLAFDQGSWIIWAPTFTGFSGTPSVDARYKLTGNTLEFFIRFTASGTSNATTKTMTLPLGLTAYGNQRHIIPLILDAGASQTSPGIAYFTSTSNTVELYKTTAAGPWTNSGNCQISGNFVIAVI